MTKNLTILTLCLVALSVLCGAGYYFVVMPATGGEQAAVIAPATASVPVSATGRLELTLSRELVTPLPPTRAPVAPAAQSVAPPESAIAVAIIGMVLLAAAMLAGLFSGRLMTPALPDTGLELVQARRTIAKLRRDERQRKERQPEVAGAARDEWQSTVSTLEAELRSRTQKFDDMQDQLANGLEMQSAWASREEEINRSAAELAADLSRREEEIEALRGELAAANDDLASVAEDNLAEQLDAQRASNDALTAERDDYRQRVEALEEGMATSSAGAEQAAASVADLSAQTESLQQQLVERDRLVAGIQEQLEQAVAAASDAAETTTGLSTRAETLQEQLAERDQVVVNLEAQLQDALDTAEDAGRKAEQAASKRLEDWQSTVSTLEAQLRERTVRQDDIADALALSQQKEEATSLASDELLGRIATLEETLAQRDDAIEDLRRKFDIADAESADLRDEVQHWHNRITDADAAGLVSQNTISDLSEQLRVAGESLQERQAQLEASDEALRVLRDQASTNETDIQAAATQSHAEIEKRDSQIASLKEQLSNSQERVVAAETDAHNNAAELNAARTSLETTSSQLNARLEDSEQRASEHEARAAEAESQVAQLTALLDDVRVAAIERADIAETKNATELAESNRQLDERDRQIAQLKGELDSLQETVAQHEQSAEAGRLESVGLDAEIQSRQKTIDNLQLELAAAQEERDSLRADTDNAARQSADELAQLREQLAAAKSEDKSAELDARLQHSNDQLATLQQQLDDASREHQEETSLLREQLTKLQGDADSDAIGSANAQTERWQSEAEDLQAKLAEARTAIDTIRETAANKETLLNKTQLRFKQSEARLKEVSAERKAQIKTIQTLKNKVISLGKADKAAASAALADRIAGAGEPLEGANEEDARARLQQIEPLFSELTSANKLLVTKQVAMQATLTNRSLALKKRAALIENLQAQLHSAQSKVKAAGSQSETDAAAQKELRDQRNRVRDLESRLSDYGSRFRNLEQARNQWQQHAAALKQALTERDSENAGADATDSEVVRLEEELAHRDKQIKAIEEALRTRTEAQQKMEKELKTWMGRVAPLVQGLRDREQKIAVLEAASGDIEGEESAGKAQEFTAQLEMRDDEIERLKSDLNVRAEMIDVLEHEVKRLEREDSEESVGEQQELRITQLEADLKVRGDIITVLENDAQKLDDLEQAVVDREQKISALEGQLQLSNKRLKEQAASSDQQAAEAPAAQAAPARFDVLHELEYQDNLKGLRAELENSRKQVKDLEAALRDQHGAGVSVNQADTAVASNQIAILRDEVEAQTVLIDNLEADLVFWKRRAETLEKHDA